jgi:hypothetical protein
MAADGFLACCEVGSRVGWRFGSEKSKAVVTETKNNELKLGLEARWCGGASGSDRNKQDDWCQPKLSFGQK